MAEIESALDFAAAVGGWLALARAQGTATMDGLTALAEVEALANEAAPVDPVLARWARSKWQAALHGDDTVVDGSAREIVRELGA